MDSEPADGSANAVGEILGVSDDAGVVYFTTAGNQLVAGGPVDPTPKIYRWEDGEVTYVAAANVTGSTSATKAMTTPDGRHLMFMSNTAGVTAAPTAGTIQQYRYDSADGSLVCTSCRTDGSPSTTSARLDQFVSFMMIDRKRRRWLSDDGRVFFETAEPLESRDTNGAVDVYTYADPAEGPRLISDGRTTSDARFADASSDGATVFFATRGQLTGWDTDERQDLYAARVGGGLPAPNDRPGGACSGDACQGQPAGGPAIADPRSAELESRGNVATTVLPRPRVARTLVRGGAGWLRVRVPARGRLTVRGPLLRRSARRVDRPGAHRIRVRLSPRGRRALARRGRLGVRIAVRFAPEAGPARVARTRLTFRANRPAQRRSRSRGASGEAR
ncbi:MAG: hypothetical protein GXY03_03600 [Solirubrobacterales bacterium]|nr:hypothetical protein [Solirubrobacterales bacterium]